MNNLQDMNYINNIEKENEKQKNKNLKHEIIKNPKKFDFVNNQNDFNELSKKERNCITPFNNSTIEFEANLGYKGNRKIKNIKKTQNFKFNKNISQKMYFSDKKNLNNNRINDNDLDKQLIHSDKKNTDK